jgi:hypothetical protein
MEDQREARGDDRPWNVMAISCWAAGLGASLCCVGVWFGLSLPAPGLFNASWVGLILFVLVTIGFLFASLSSKRRRGSTEYGIAGAVLGIVVPVAFVWWLLSHMWA